MLWDMETVRIHQHEMKRERKGGEKERKRIFQQLHGFLLHTALIQAGSFCFSTRFPQSSLVVWFF